MDDIESTRDILKRQLREATTANPLEALKTIGALQSDITAEQSDAVRAALRTHSWAEVGQALGVSKQAAHQKWAKAWAAQLKDELKTEHHAMKAALAQGTSDNAAAAKARRDAVIAEFKTAGKRRG